MSCNKYILPHKVFNLLSQHYKLQQQKMQTKICRTKNVTTNMTVKTWNYARCRCYSSAYSVFPHREERDIARLCVRTQHIPSHKDAPQFSPGAVVKQSFALQHLCIESYLHCIIYALYHLCIASYMHYSIYALHYLCTAYILCTVDTICTATANSSQRVAHMQRQHPRPMYC